MSDEKQFPEAAPAVVMDQRGNYWRVYPAGHVLGAEGETWSMCPVSTENYDSEPIAVYRQGRDLSAKQAQELLSRIFCRTDVEILKTAATAAWHAWVTGRDMVTEAELLLQKIAIQVGADSTAKRVPDGSEQQVPDA